ncbi:MAG: hypothetical protein IKE17_05410 [Clostridia bacterium]|nr:hypothetical protein [Clostridia bacterium]
MKKLITALLLIAMLIQVLPFEALATVGKVLSKEELARAYALTGLGTGGLKANSNGTYHSGMKPNLSWNASQLYDWLDEKLVKDLNSAEDLLSQVSFTLEEMKQSNPAAYEKFTQATPPFNFVQMAQELYLEAEALRQTLRWHQDQLTEASNTIAEMSRRMEEEGDGMFDSDKVRWSARIEEATREIVEIRQTIAANSDLWEKRIEEIQDNMVFGPAGDAESQAIGTWMDTLFRESGQPQTNQTSVSRVSPNASRSGRLSSAAGLAANDVADAKITVITENEVAIVLQTGTKEKPVPVKGVDVWADDVLNNDDPVLCYHSNENGAVVLPVNLFRTDEFDVVHLRLKVDPTKQGFRDYVVEDMDLEKGEVLTHTLTPINDAPANPAGGAAVNAEGDPYVYMMSFGTKDIMHKEYDMVYSPLNDYEFEIKVGVRNTEGKKLPDLLMRYYRYGKTDLGPSFDKLEECWASPTRKEGDVYVFKGKWKQLFAPKTNKAQRPTFMFGKDAPASLTFRSQLVSQQSATEKPLNEGTGPNGGIFSTVLSQGMSFGFMIPVVDIKVSFELPYKEYLPRLFVDPGGYVVIYMGAPVFEDKIKKSKMNWQSSDLRSFKQVQKFVEKEGMLANYKAQYNLAKDLYKEKAWKFFGESKFNVGLFVVLTGRWELDKDIPNVITKNISIRGGVGVTLSYSFSWTVSYPIGPVPVYVCFTLGVSAGFAMEIAVDFCIVNGNFRNWNLRPVNNITITVGFLFSGQLGFGIKGFLEAWVRLTASLNFNLRLSIIDTSPSSFTIVGALDLTVGATVFFVSLSKNWKIGEKQFWPKTSANLLDHYMNAEANDETKTVEAVSDEPYRYPALTPEMKEIKATYGQGDGGSDSKILRIGGRVMLFTIQQTLYNKKPVRRVYWCCLNADTDTGGLWNSVKNVIESTGQYRSFGEFVLPRSDYDFDVYTDGQYVYLVATCAKEFDKNGYPVRNDLSTTNSDDMNMGIYYMVLEHDGKGQLGWPKDDVLAAAYDTKQGYASSYMTYPKYTHVSYSNPLIAQAEVVRKDNKVDHFEIYGQCETISYSKDEKAVGTTGFAVTERMMLLFTDKTVKSALGDNYERVKALSLMNMDAVGRSKHEQSMINGYAMSFVGLSKPKNGGAGDSAIELYAYDMNRGKGDRKAIVLEKGDIGHIAMVEDRLSKEWNKSGRTVFYTMHEKSDDGVVRNRLHGLYIAPVKDAGGDHPSYEVTKYTYDALMPSGEFDICYLGGAPYLYWVSTTEKRKDSDPDIWRVWTMCYDPVANTVTAPSVFAEFTIPNITYTPRDQFGTGHWYHLPAAPGSVILTGTGTAYVNAVASDWEFVPESLKPKLPPTSLFSFKELLTPSANLTAAIPRQLAVKAGDFEDVTLGLRNEGNLAISTVDVAMYEVVNGVEGKNPVSTVHINAKDPAKSKVTYYGSGNLKATDIISPTALLKFAEGKKGEVVMTGRPAGYREEDYDMTSRKRDWVLDQQTTQYTLSIGDSVGVDAKVTGASAPRHIKTDILFPGSTGSFMGAFKIPANWNGDKTLRMKVVKATVESNLARAVANSAGLAANAPASATLEYVLNEKTGKLELQASAQANVAVENAIASGLYANEIDTSSADMLIHVQDVEVKHRIYEGLEGERMLDIVVHNHAATRVKLTLSCAVYVDGSSDPYVLNLPYYNNTSSRRTQTITLPVSALVDDVTKHESARVVITAVGTDERAYANNEFSVYFDGDTALGLLRQPDDTTVQEGEDVAFTVEVTGGTAPYSYQWQIYNPQTGEWEDLEGFTRPTMSREDVEEKWDGCRFRCVVTDAAGEKIVTEEFTLTVRDRVDTGDHSNLPLYLGVALVALALLLALRRWRKAI